MHTIFTILFLTLTSLVFVESRNIVVTTTFARTFSETTVTVQRAQDVKLTFQNTAKTAPATTFTTARPEATLTYTLTQTVPV